MFGFMLDETETHDNGTASASCQICHIRLAPRAPRVVIAEAVHHRDCYEAVHLKKTGKRPRLVSASAVGGNGHTYRPAA